jgi:hypothetical protein
MQQSFQFGERPKPITIFPIWGKNLKPLFQICITQGPQGGKTTTSVKYWNYMLLFQFGEKDKPITTFPIWGKV